MEYNPDCWVVLKISAAEHGTHYRLFGGWYGGYCGSDSWKMNSGITKVDVDGDVYLFHGESGSVYRCHKNTERMSGYMMNIYTSYKNQETEANKIDIIDFEDFMKEFNV